MSSYRKRKERIMRRIITGTLALVLDLQALVMGSRPPCSPPRRHPSRR